MTGESTVAAQAANQNGRNGYGLDGGAGASLAVRSGERGRPVRLTRARRTNRYRSGYVNDSVKTFTPLGDFWNFTDPRNNFPGFPGSSGGSTSPTGGSSGGGFDWSQVFGVITQAAPAIISAARGQGVPPGYYPAAVQGQQIQYQQIPPGYQYVNGQLVDTRSAGQAAGQFGVGAANIANSLTSFVTANPLLILGGVVAVALLFKTPPSRR